jgi:hypothetical protein
MIRNLALLRSSFAIRSVALPGTSGQLPPGDSFFARSRGKLRYARRAPFMPPDARRSILQFSLQTGLAAGP